MDGFQCKQFFVSHDQCAMKVGTDSLILGSVATPHNARRILDIGTGSGLLALMMAQQSNSNCMVDAVEIDYGAATQAVENCKQSPWAKRLTVFHTDIADYQPIQQYDLIIANPPYFEGPVAHAHHYPTMSALRKLARLEQGLTMRTFFSHCWRLLAKQGRIYCLYPFRRHNDVNHAIEALGLYINAVLIVRNKPDSEPTICVYTVSSVPSALSESSLIIRDCDNRYSLAYRHLCRAFYIHF